MEHRDGTFAGAGGVDIYWQAWADSAPTRAAIVVAHGGGEHGGRYARVAERLVPLGFPVYALDHRGHGRSGGKRALIDRMTHAVADLDAFVDRARGEHPEVPLFLLGHSMGGCISLEYAIAHQAKLDGLVLSAPLAALEAANPVMRGVAKLLSAVAPATPLIKVDASAVSRDPGEVAAYDNDPLVLHGKLPVRTIAEFAAVIDTFEARIPQITIPLLVMHGNRDRLAPVRGGRMVHERAGSADKTYEEYDGFYHELFNEPPADRERVLDDVVAWLQARS